MLNTIPSNSPGHVGPHASGHMLQKALCCPSPGRNTSHDPGDVLTVSQASAFQTLEPPPQVVLLLTPNLVPNPSSDSGSSLGCGHPNTEEWTSEGVA